MKSDQFVAVVRDVGTKETVPSGEAVERINQILETMHTRMFERYVKLAGCHMGGGVASST